MSAPEKSIITLNIGDSNSAQIHLFGATVISWKCSGNENLFLSSTSKMDGSKAVRGGIPLVFPNFGPWKLGPQHGFARSMWWTVSTPPKKIEGEKKMMAVFQLVDNDESRKIWNHKFLLQYTVILSETELITQLDITNTDKESFDFTTLLHTYFKVNDITTSKIIGFKGCQYLDKVKNSDKEETEDRTEIVIDENVDNIYKNTIGHTLVNDEFSITLKKTNLPDTVLWNPWIEKAAKMSDFDDDGYKKMVCIEAGYVAQRKVLTPSETFTCQQTLTCLPTNSKI